MKAVVFTRYGPPDVLELKEVERPNPGDDEILIRVHAASINDWDWGALHGADFVNRLLFGLSRPRKGKQILGSDVAGRVEAVGRDVRRFEPGDEVFGDLSGTWGGFAEYVCARESALARKPPSMTFEQAAAIPQAAMLAVQGLRDVGRLQAGQKVLINGAGGGVGTFAIQIARLYGAEITGVDGPGKLDLLRSLGAHHVIDYTREDFTRSGKAYDLILDVKTSRSVLDCARALNRQGTYVTVGGSLPRLFQAMLVAPWLRLTGKKAIRVVVLKANKDLDYMNELFEAGQVTPVIDGPYELAKVPEAFRLFGEARHKGKVVITVRQPDGSSAQANRKKILSKVSGEDLTPNKDTVERYMEGFRTSDHERVLSCLTDDVEWEIPGGFHVRGKAAFDAHIQDEGFTGSPDITVTRLTEENDVVVAEGSVRTRRTDGSLLNLVFCDVFEMRGGRIRRLTSYLMEERHG